MQLNLEINSQKKMLIWISSMSASHWWHLFHKNVKTWDSISWFKIVKSQPRCKVGNFECMSWRNSFFSGVGHRGFLKEGVNTYLMAPISSLISPTFFKIVTSILSSGLEGLSKLWYRRWVFKRLILLIVKNNFQSAPGSSLSQWQEKSFPCWELNPGLLGECQIS